MSRRKLSKKSALQASLHSDALLSLADLQKRWNTLKLSVQTQERLQRLFVQEGGAFVALAATEAIALERGREDPALSSSVMAWFDEELRMLFLEEGSSHLVESGKIIMEALLAWNIAQMPERLSLPLLDVGLAVGCLLLFWLAHLLCRSRRDDKSERFAHSSHS